MFPGAVAYNSVSMRHISAVAAALVAGALGVSLHAQSIFTFAGGGTTNGRPATTLSLHDVGGMATDPQGNVYFSETSGNFVHRLDVGSGTLTVFAGNGGGSFSGDGGAATRASLKAPYGIAFDDAGNLYIADHDNNRIRKVDTNGVITTFAGVDTYPGSTGDGGAATQAWVYRPRGVAWSRGSLYIAQDGYAENRVRRITPDGKISTIAGTGADGFSGDGGPAIAAQLSVPSAVAVDANGNVYVADSGNNRVRRIDAASGNITTVIGGGTPADEIGDNGPGTSAALFAPVALALDGSGRVVVSDTYHSRIRRWDPASKVITTIAGNGGYHDDDGMPALQTGIYASFAIAFDPAGNLFAADGSNASVRRIDAASSIVTTVAGGGDFIGDGLLATNALLSGPRGVAIDARGNLFIADSYHALVRRVDAATGVISTFAGKLNTYYSETDAADVKDLIVADVTDLAFDGNGNLYILGPYQGKIWKVDPAGKVVVYAGGGTPADSVGDGGLATNAEIHPLGMALDAAGNLYIADADNYPDTGKPTRHRLRKVDAQSKIIRTIAGGEKAGFAGDGDDAAKALLDTPTRVTVDASGNIFISDAGNQAVRRIDGRTNVITTYAGRGNPPDGSGDNLPATQAVIAPRALVADRKTGDLYVADDNYGDRIRKIDATTKVITTVAGSSVATEPGFSGDSGKATDARLNFQYETSGLALDANGSLYIADTVNHRVRVVYGCVAVTAPHLTAPADGASATVASPALAWTATPGAFRYDLYLDTASNPQRLVATDLDNPGFTPSNLLPNTKYYWRVVAKGDPFCAARSSASSAVASFTTAATCAAADFDAVAPASGAQIATTSVLLTWNASPGASTYDVFLSSFTPPARLAAGITDTSYRAEVVAGTYSWFIVAHASCNASQTASTPLRTFTVSAANNCPFTFTVSPVSPANGATEVSQSVDVSWSASGSTDRYDLYLGTATDPPLYASNLVAAHQFVPSLEAGTMYRWRVVAHTPCNNAAVSSAVATFTTRSCSVPGATSILFAPQSVTSGSTYSIVWSPAAGLDTSGAYLLERSASAGFQSILDSQVISTTAASLLAGAPGVVYHRVRAVSGCDPSKVAPVSDAVAVTIVAAPPNVVFTVQPAAKIVGLGDRLEDTNGAFTLENLGASAVQVIVGRQEINNSPPFFSIADPDGQDAAFITLEPHKPHAFTIRYSGPSNTVPASYQGVVFVAAIGAALPVTPYAFVNLKVGGTPSSAPQFIVDGVASDYASFPALSGDDSNRATLQIGVRNNGSSAMDVAFEIGPELWLTTDATWNATTIPPNATRTVNLSTRRSRAPNGSALPRYTYLTVRTRDGGAARLLVQDNDEIAVSNGRPARLDAGVRSFIVPEVSSRQGTRGVVATRLRLSNVGSDAVQAQLIFTPAAADGFDPQAVRRVTVPVPANDVVTLTDPIVQVFKLARPAEGQIEVRLAAERVGLINVSATTVFFGGGGVIALPVVNRGEGSRTGETQLIPGITKSPALVTSVVFAETSGNDHAVVRARLRDLSGALIGAQVTADVPRYGHVRMDDIVASANLGSADHATLELGVDSGGGIVSGTAILQPVGSDGGTAIGSRPLVETSVAGAVANILARRRTDDEIAEAPSVSRTTVVPLLGTPTSSGSAPAYRTMVGFGAPSGAAATFIATFYRAGLNSIRQTFAVPAGSTRIVDDVLGELFGQPLSASGSVFVDAPTAARVYAIAQPVGSGPVPLPPASIPLPTTLSEALTSATVAQRPLFVDGLEQSTDSTRGTRWMLLLNEVAGASGVVNVRLYEAANRSVPIAEKNISISGQAQIQLDTVFGALGLDAPDRRKDRTNVQCVVTAQSGSARVSATAIGIDNVTGATQVIALAPSAGSATPSVSLVTPVIVSTPPTSSRRRAVRH
jgi:sugar lactone lactonase YvrE